jgi:hypothetical protein
MLIKKKSSMKKNMFDKISLFDIHLVTNIFSYLMIDNKTLSNIHKKVRINFEYNKKNKIPPKKRKINKIFC